MTEKSVRQWIGVLLILIHLCLFGVLFITFLFGGFRYDEFTTSVAIITPMFAGYTTAITVYFARNRFVSVDHSRRVTLIFLAMSAAFPILFLVALVTSVLLYASSKVFENFEAFKGTLTLLEAVFAAYVANFVYTLFDRAEIEPEDRS